MHIPIGELSAKTGVKVPTIRYYEKIGLMQSPLRTDGHQRRYGKDELRRLKFIRHARELGLEIAEIRELLSLSAEPNRSCRDADHIVDRHVTQLELRLARLIALRDELKQMVSGCSGKSISECRVIEALSDHSKCSHSAH